LCRSVASSTRFIKAHASHTTNALAVEIKDAICKLDWEESITNALTCAPILSGHLPTLRVLLDRWRVASTMTSLGSYAKDTTKLIADINEVARKNMD
jgi:hypothetical protein